MDPEIVLLTVDGELIETTPEHPFYVIEPTQRVLTESEAWQPLPQTAGRWVDAGELAVGDHVWRADGSTGVVESVEVVAVEQRMYNLTVDVAHTFFVGDGAWLVHNCGKAPKHHIGTNKSLKGTSYSGGPWSPGFEKIFDKAGMSLKRDAANLIRVPGHKGPHPNQYHQIVYDRLTQATKGLSGKKYKSALQKELNAIGQEILDTASFLNRLVTKK